MVQNVLSGLLLAISLSYSLFIVFLSRKRKAKLEEAPGTLSFLLPAEGLVYFIASFGISDFMLNTLLVKNKRLTQDEILPGTLITCAAVPNSLMASLLLRSGNPIDLRTLLICVAVLVLGTLLGDRLVAGMTGAKIKAIMRTALIASFVFLLGKTILSAGAAGTATSLTTGKLCIAAAICFLSGVLNMFGIPMKPVTTATFLLLGMSPLATLTLILAIGAVTPVAGALPILRRGNYQPKVVLGAATCGILGVLLGINLAVSVPSAILNIALLCVMFFTIVTLFRS